MFQLLVSVGFLLAPSTQPAGPDLAGLRLNQIQVIGSHNSYKQPIEPGLLELAKSAGRDLTSLDYAHPSLRDQLNLGLRNLEIDIYNDPSGGLFASPLALKLLASAGKTPRPFDPEHEMLQPGFKVLHIHDIDFRSHNLTLTGTLKELRSWSEQNPAHVPVFVLMNLKSGAAGFSGETKPIPFDAAALSALDADIRTHLGSQRLLTPDDIRGDDDSLRHAVVTRGWPSLDAARGRFIFILDEGDPVRGLYLRDNPTLAGRVLFPTVNIDHPAAAILVINDPLGKATEIRAAVDAGFIVRTRADAGTTEMRTGDLGRFAAAAASGAQVISTDYYLPDWRINPDFVVRFAGAPFSRRNPVTAPNP